MQSGLSSIFHPPPADYSGGNRRGDVEVLLVSLSAAVSWPGNEPRDIIQNVDFALLVVPAALWRHQERLHLERRLVRC